MANRLGIDVSGTIHPLELVCLLQCISGGTMRLAGTWTEKECAAQKIRQEAEVLLNRCAVFDEDMTFGNYIAQRAYKKLIQIVMNQSKYDKRTATAWFRAAWKLSGNDPEIMAKMVASL